MSQKAVTLTLDVEGQVKSLLKDLSTAATGSNQAAGSSVPGSSSSTAGSRKRAERQYIQLFDSLLGHGFNQQQVQQVLQALPLGSATLESCLDWLCLNLPPSQLPRKFAGSVKGGGAQVKVLAAAGPGKPSDVKNDSAGEYPHCSTSSSDGEKAEQAAAQGIGLAAAGGVPEAPKEQDSAASSKAWILQYMDRDSSDSDEDQGCSTSARDDFELWADPREVSRRAAERARAKVPPEVRRRQVAHEYARAKDFAAQAKAGGDKAKQKEAGQIIRDIKKEMEGLGLVEAVAVAMVEEDRAAAIAGGDGGEAAGLHASGDKDLQQEGCQAVPDTGQAGQAGKDGGQSGKEGRGEAAAELVAERASGSASTLAGAATADTPAGRAAIAGPSAVSMQQGSEAVPTEEREGEDDWEAAFGLPVAAGPATALADASTADAEDAWAPDLDLFGSDLSELPSVSGSRLHKGPASAPEQLLPWGTSTSASSGAGRKQQQQQQRKGQKGAGSGAPEVRQPMAVLSQLCLRNGWQQPRFSKLEPVAGAADDRVRYSVSVDMGQARAVNKKKGLFGVHTFQLDPSQDGWGSVAEAQNAACARALWELDRAGAAPGSAVSRGAACASQPPELAVGLPLEFQHMWLGWSAHAEGQGQGQASGAPQEQLKARLDFVQSLLSGGTGNAVPEAGGGDQGASGPDAGVSGEEGAEKEEWEELLGEQTRQEQEAAARQQQEQQQQQLAEDTRHADAAQARLSSQMLQHLERWRSCPEGQRMGAQRAALPVAAVKGAVMKALEQGDVVVVVGDTGCGKTTQVPQYILEQATEAGLGGACNAVCTQPRRIAAISVAERVAVERGEPPPGRPGSSVGYHVRLDASVTRDTRLTFCTTGILLRRLAADPSLSSVSHVIVDEVHERSVQGDFLAALLRKLVEDRRRSAEAGEKLGGTALPRLKVVLMSATLDAEMLSRYFGGCPVVTAEGRTFPVDHFFLEDVYGTTQYRLEPDSPAALRGRHKGGAGGGASAAEARLRRQVAGGDRATAALVAEGWGDDEGSGSEGMPLNPYYDAEAFGHLSDLTRRNLGRVNEERIDFDLLEALVCHIDREEPEGAILVFLPGMGEIQQLHRRLSSIRQFSRGAAAQWLLPLHSTVAPQEQRMAFKVPPTGVRKVVLATNIAETSLTIEDVVYVVDTGRHKERRYDASRHMALLVEDWVSRASARQRKGRAGRVRPGNKCFSLFTRPCLEGRMRAFQVPEIKRVPLEELVLQIHIMELAPAAQFLEQVLEPPAPRSIAASVAMLQDVGALSPDEQLTPLGRHLALLPVEPRLGKLLVLGACLSCLGPALTVAAAMSHKSPFAAGFDKREENERARRALGAPGSGTIASGQQSDHLLLVAAYDAWAAAGGRASSSSSHDGQRRSRGRGGQAAEAEARKVARKYQLDEEALSQLAEVRAQLFTMLLDAGLVSAPASSSDHDSLPLDAPSMPWNRLTARPEVLKAVLCAALVPNVAAVLEGSAPLEAPKWQAGPNLQADEVELHPACLARSTITSRLPAPFVVYLEKVKTSRVFLREVTPVSPMALLLFGGPLQVLHEEAAVLVNGWVRVRAAAQVAVVVKKLRQALDQVLERRVRGGSNAGNSKPSGSIEQATTADEQVISTIVQLLSNDEKTVAV